ncbi:MAG: hypothetical protein ABTQ34_01100 [Bdellovibrionales bacterium]
MTMPPPFMPETKNLPNGQPEPPRPRRVPGIVQAFLFLVASVAALMPHFMIGAQSGLICFAWLVPLIVATLAMSAEMALSILLASLCFQNTMIAVVTPQIVKDSNFTILQATNFGILCLVTAFAGPAWLRMRKFFPAANGRLLQWTFLFFVVIVVFTGIGIVNSSPASALIYARTYLTGLMMMAVGLALGSRFMMNYMSNIVRAIALICVVWGVLEYTVTGELYGFFNFVDYMRLKWANATDAVFTSIQDVVNFGNHAYLNLSGQLGSGVEILRLKGPTLHTISYGYVLAFCCLVSYIYHRPVLALATFALVMLVGAKGPMILTILSIGLSLIYTRTRNHRWLMLALTVCLGIIFVSGLIYGFYTNDYHILGLMGGVRGFLENPLGRGIGVGGNLSDLGQKELNFALYQQTGTADFALESAFGVMIYQIGLFGTVVFLLFYRRLWTNVMEAVLARPEEPRLIVVPIALAFLIVNSVFQEEVFLPTGWGLWLLLSGMLMARHWRQNLPGSDEIRARPTSSGLTFSTLPLDKKLR